LRNKLTIVVLGGVAFSAMLILIWPNLGLNLFAEALGVAFTVYGIQWLLDEEQRERTKPARLTAIRDATKVYHACFSLLDDMLRSYTLVEDLETLSASPSGDFPDSILPILNRLDMARTGPGVSVALNDAGFQHTDLLWASVLPISTNEIRQAAERFLDRHTFTVPPRLVQLIHELIDGVLLRMMERPEIMARYPANLQFAWPDFKKEVNALRDELKRCIDMDQKDESKRLGVFDAALIAKGVREHPYAHPHAPWRPPNPNPHPSSAPR
jgi:hypothetical protein